MDPTGQGTSNEGRRDLTSIILRNAICASFGSWFARVSHFIFIIYAVRTLGEVDLGRYATIVAFVGLFGVFSELGMSQYSERSIARDHTRAAELFWNLLILRAMLAVVGIVGISTIALNVYDRELAFGVFLFSLTFLMSALLVPPVTILTGNERFDLATGIYLIGQVVTVGLGFVLLWAGLGIYALLITGFVAMPLQIIVAITLVRRYRLSSISFKVSPRGWGKFIRASLPFGITSLALTFNYNVDTVILGFFRSDAEVGWYNASYRLVFNAVGIVGAFLVVMTPSLAREHKLSPERVRVWIRTSIHWMIVFAIPAGAGLSLVARDTVAFLYGESFRSAGPVASIIAWDIPLFVLLAVFGNITAATGRERQAAKVYVASAGGNVVLNMMFIPFYGMYAAAAVTVFSDLITVIIFFILLRDIIEFHPRFSGLLARVGVATSVMGAALWFSGGFPLLVMIALGGLVYLVSAVGLRIINLAALLVGLRRIVGRFRLQHKAT